jgi:hypothetical protein
MEEHLQAIRAALAAPTEEARRAGANACRTLLQALESVQPPGGGAEPSLPTPLHVVPTAGAVLLVQEKGTESLLEVAPSPPAAHDTATVPPSAATQPVGTTSAVPTLPVLPGGVALASLFGRGAGAIDPTVVAAFVSAVKNLKPEQWVDLLLSKLLTFVGTQGASSPMALPPGPPVAPVAAPVARQPYQVQLVPARPGWVAPSGNRRR